ncbi:kinase-like domain-containing protein, partial [Pavlovales sp. CCMP2436]
MAGDSPTRRRAEAPNADEARASGIETLAERRRRRRVARELARVAELPEAVPEPEPEPVAPQGGGRRPTAFEPSGKLARYTPLRTLGKGTFGVASLVRDEQNGSLSVLKRIECECLEDANDALAEAAALASVRSARVLTLHSHLLEYDEASGVLAVCILTDYCAGGDLASRIASVRSAGARFSERCLLTWLVHMCEGLADIHAVGMIHRDLKPANMLLLTRARAIASAVPADDTCGGLKIGDLGVATLRGCVGAYTVVGSPAYMAPEVFGGSSYSHRADMWSLGVLLVELATLRRP